MLNRIVLVVLLALLGLSIAENGAPAVAKRRMVPFHRDFANPTPISLLTTNDKPASASLYPSTISVNGMKGRITQIDVVLHDISHTAPGEVEALLVGPNGQRSIVIANVCGTGDLTDARLRLSSEATLTVPDQATSCPGNWEPTSATGNPIAFSAPAPAGTVASASFAVFLGTNPNGTWRLFVQDENGPADPGAIAGGWDLEIDTLAKLKKKKR